MRWRSTLSALGVGPGSRVLTTPFSFFATASTIVRLGARPVFGDIDPVTMNLDPAAAAETLERAAGRVSGMVVVHLFGRLADMAGLGAVAERHGLWILEDAAQAAGARDGGRSAGAFGRAGAVSFYPSKNLGGIGDGGMVLTDDAELAGRVRRDRAHGLVAAYEHEAVGLCSRLDAVNAAALRAKLPHLDGWNARRRMVADWYDDGLSRARPRGGARRARRVAAVGGRGARPSRLHGAGAGAGRPGASPVRHRHRDAGLLPHPAASSAAIGRLR